MSEISSGLVAVAEVAFSNYLGKHAQFVGPRHLNVGDKLVRLVDAEVLLTEKVDRAVSAAAGHAKTLEGTIKQLSAERDRLIQAVAYHVTARSYQRLKLIKLHEEVANLKHENSILNGGCTRSHPHEEMSMSCIDRTTIVRLTRERDNLVKAIAKIPDEVMQAERVISNWFADNNIKAFKLGDIQRRDDAGEATEQREAARYRKLKTMLHAADFDYGDDHLSVLVFSLPSTASVSADLDATLDGIDVAPDPTEATR